MSTIDGLVLHAIADGSRDATTVAAWVLSSDGLALSPDDIRAAVARCKARALLGGVDGSWLLLDAGLRGRHRSVGPLVFRQMCEAAVTS